jgi:hypothetical protein
MQGSPPLGSYMSAMLMPPQERTKGDDTAPTVSAHGTITTKITWLLLLGPPLPPFGAPYTARSQVNFGRLARPPEGITPFMVAGLVRTPAIEEQERGLSTVEPLTRGTTDLMISDRQTTPYHRADPPSLTPDLANPNPNGLGSGSPPRISPLDNWIICRVIRLPTSTHTRPAAGYPGIVIDARPSDSMVR